MLSDPWAYRYFEKSVELDIKNVHVHKGLPLWPLHCDSFHLVHVHVAAFSLPELFAPAHWPWGELDVEFSLERPPEHLVSNVHLIARCGGRMVVCAAPPSPAVPSTPAAPCRLLAVRRRRRCDRRQPDQPFRR